MPKNLPDFPAFRQQLAPMRTARERVAAVKETHSLEGFAGRWLPLELLRELESMPGTRNRWLPLRMVFWAFLNMVLHPGAPCREAQRSVQAWWARLGKLWRNPCTSAFTAARARLPMGWLRRLWQRSAERMVAAAPTLPGCYGRRVLVVDGTSVTTPDSAENQEQWPQPSSQKPGCGWPFISIVGIFCLSSGALLRAAHGALKTHEARLFAFIRRVLRQGDILVADRGYWSFANLALLPMRGADMIVRGRYANRVDWRKGKRLGKSERIVTMTRPSDKSASKVMSKRLWSKLPERIEVRQIRAHATRPGFRAEELFLVSTLLDPKLWPAEVLVRLYLRRWRVELNFDDIKTTMRAAAMRCMSPEMVRRELLMHAIAYNLIRRIMLESAWQEDVSLDQISFKGTLDTARHWQHAVVAKRGRAARESILEEMLLLCASDLLLVRPGRSEPRATKRRPKGYQYLTSPRRKMIVSPSRSLKGRPSKSKKTRLASA